MAEQQISRGGNCVALAISGTSARTAMAFHGIVALTVTTSCFIRQGDTPTALIDVDQFLLAGAIYEYAVRGKIAAITSSATGTLYITPLG